jgi:hypothetical protein
MLSRRELLGAGLAGGITATDAAPASHQGQAELELLREIARGVTAVDRTMAQSWMSSNTAYGLVAKVRAQFEIYFRSAQRFPDFIDVGYAVFIDLYDWHIRNRQQLTITRAADNRYWMQFMFTTVVLRGEQDPNFIGVPYEKA